LDISLHQLGAALGLIAACTPAPQPAQHPRPAPPVFSKSGPTAPPPAPAPPPEPPKSSAPPSPESPKDLVALDHELPSGCFAWSEASASAFCVTDSGSIQKGERFFLEIFGPKPRKFILLDLPARSFTNPPLVVQPSDKAEVLKLLEGAERLPSAEITFDPEAPAIVESGRLTVRWIRNKVRHVSLVDGSWDVFAERVELRCGDRGRFAPIITGSVENPMASGGKVLLAGGHYAIIERSVTWAIEGDSGGSTEATLIDLDTRCPARTH
jgi:hypothetical protein